MMKVAVDAGAEILRRRLASPGIEGIAIACHKGSSARGIQKARSG